MRLCFHEAALYTNLALKSVLLVHVKENLLSLKSFSFIYVLQHTVLQYIPNINFVFLLDKKSKRDPESILKLLWKQFDSLVGQLKYVVF